VADVTVTEAGPHEKLISFEIAEAELDSAKNAAARKISHEVKIRGFRPGKAPRAIVEATVGADRLRSEAIDEMLPDKVGDVLTEMDIEPAVPPALESIEDSDAGIKVEVKVTTWPSLDDVPEIHDRIVEVGSVEVTDAELEAQVDRFREQFASVEVVERPAALGDYVSMDISATMDGEEVPEAAAAGLLYEVGSGGLIEALDDSLVGASADDVVTFDGPLPDGFGEKAGLEVSYTVKVSDVRERILPEVTDDWVAETTEFETVEEMRTTLLDQMSQMKRRSLAGSFQDKALDQLIDEVVVELPEALVRAEMDEVFHRFSHRLEEQQISLEDYFRVTGVDQQAFISDLESQAERSLKTRLLLEAVIDSEGLEVGETELASVIEMVVASSEDPERIRLALEDDRQVKNLAGDILRNKALEAIVNGARAVDEDGNDVDLAIAPPVTAETVEAEAVEFTENVVEAEVVEAEVIASNEEE
jgi:trigger factor